MEFEAKMTSEGQILIPLEIRKDLGVKAGDTISFGKNSDGEIVLRASRKESRFA